MSEQNIERHRRLADAFNARDVEAFIALCDPKIELHSAMAAVGGGVYHGHDGLREFFHDFEETWRNEIRVEVEAYFDLGEHTLASYVLHGRGRQSGVEVAMPTAQVVRWQDGLVVYLKAYVHREDAFGDLGVSEDALRPIPP